MKEGTVKELINDNWGFSEALLSFVGDTPNEIEESFDNSQKLNSILKIISEVEEVTKNGEYTVKKYQKNLVIKVLSGATSINLRSEEGAVNNKVLVLNASGNLLTINDADVIENGDFIKYLYDGESFQKISNIARTESIAGALIKRSENGTAEVNIPVNDLDIANKKYVDDNSVKRLPIASNDTLGGIKVGGRFYVSENGMLADIFDGTPVRTGYAHNSSSCTDIKFYDYGNGYIKMECTVTSYFTTGTFFLMSAPLVMNIEETFQEYSNGRVGYRILNDYNGILSGYSPNTCKYILKYKCTNYPLGIIWN